MDLKYGDTDFLQPRYLRSMATAGENERPEQWLLETGTISTEGVLETKM